MASQLTIDGREVPTLAPPEKHGEPERLFEFAFDEPMRGSLSLAGDDEFEEAMG
jgi:hypothetical protein